MQLTYNAAVSCCQVQCLRRASSRHILPSLLFDSHAVALPLSSEDYRKEANAKDDLTT
jgi:hypothetical protein